MNKSTKSTPSVKLLGTSMILAKTLKDPATGKGSRVFSKVLPYHLPTLDTVSAAFPAPDRIEEREAEAGDQVEQILVPVYDNPILAYLQTALTQRIQGLARSRDEVGHPQCATWDEIMESGGSGTRYPVVLKEFRIGFLEYLRTEEFGEAQQIAIMGLTNNSKLAIQADARKARFAEVLQGFADSLGDEAEEFTMVFNILSKAINTEVEDTDF